MYVQSGENISGWWYTGGICRYFRTNFSLNFTLDGRSIDSLARNLHSLHVTGAPVMNGLDGLKKLSILNLGK